MEIWKNVESIKRKSGEISYYIGYEVSNYGRVRSYKYKYGRGKRPLLQTPTIINGRLDQVGYPQYILSDINGKRKNVRGHMLVMQTFVGLPDPGMVICHYDDVKTNNHIDNLRYDTQKSNLADMKRNSKI